MRLDPENPERVRLLLDIAEGTPIKEDTVGNALQSDRRRAAP
jgi:hypothetical protein